MASRCCGNRLSLPNQYDTENPARESLVGGRWRPHYIRAVRRPSPDLARYRLASRITCTAWVSKYPWRNLSDLDKEKFRNKSSELSRPPDSALRTSAKS